MKVIPKRLNSVTIKTASGFEKTVTDTESDAVATRTIADWEQKKTLHVGDALIPLHAVVRFEKSAITTTRYVADNTCVMDCNSMRSPIILGNMTELEVETNEEFDPLDGITAYDDNGNELTITVSIEGENE